MKKIRIDDNVIPVDRYIFNGVTFLEIENTFVSAVENEIVCIDGEKYIATEVVVYPETQSQDIHLRKKFQDEVITDNAVFCSTKEFFGTRLVVYKSNNAIFVKEYNEYMEDQNEM